MQVLIVVPRFNTKLGAFNEKSFENNENAGFLQKSVVFLSKENPRQGCTKPKTELGMHQNLYFQ